MIIHLFRSIYPNKKFCGITVILTISAICSTALATTIIGFSLEEKVKQSDTIIIGKIMSVANKESDQDIVSVRVIEVIKGSLKTDHIDVQTDKGILLIEKKYVLFLTRQNSSYRLFQYEQGRYPIRNQMYVRHLGKTIKVEEFINKIKTIQTGKRKGKQTNKDN